MNVVKTLVGRSPGDSFPQAARLAAFRALRTFLQGVAASIATGAAGSTWLEATYWEAFGVSVVGAALTAAASFLQNIALFFPEDPTQKDPR